MSLIVPCFTYNSYNLMPLKTGVHFPTSLNLGWPGACFVKNNESKMRVTLVPMWVLRDIEYFLGFMPLHWNRPGLFCWRMRPCKPEMGHLNWSHSRLVTFLIPSQLTCSSMRTLSTCTSLCFNILSQLNDSLCISFLSLFFSFCICCFYVFRFTNIVQY